MCETDKKGLTELSEINLVRPFFVMDFSLLSSLEFFVDPKNVCRWTK